MDTCYCICFDPNSIDACFRDRSKARQFIINKYLIHDRAYSEFSEEDIFKIADRYIVKTTLIG